MLEIGLGADEYFALWNTAPWENFGPQHFLLLNTFCSLEHFAPQHSLLPRTLFSEHLANL